MLNEQHENNILQVINPAEIKVRTFIDAQKDFEVKDAASLDYAVDLMKQETQIKKNLTAHQKEDCEPLNKALKEIKARYKLPIDLCEELDGILRPKVNKYMDEQRRIQEAKDAEEKRRKEEEALKEAQKLEELKKEGAQYDPETQKAIEASVEARQNQLIEATSKGNKTNLSTDKMVMRKVWAFEVVDIAQVPGEYMQLNQVAVNAAIREGKREIPGLRIFETTSVAIRG